MKVNEAGAQPQVLKVITSCFPFLLAVLPPCSLGETVHASGDPAFTEAGGEQNTQTQENSPLITGAESWQVINLHVAASE